MKNLSHRPCYSQSAQSKSGFTLIELLVVIAIIALLAAILFPVFGRARENARRSACQSNMKQIGLGIAQYVQDYDERFPFQTTTPVANYANSMSAWIPKTMPYIKSWQVFACPSAPRSSADPPNGNSDGSYFASAFIISLCTTYNATSNPSPWVTSLVNIVSPSAVAMVTDGGSRSRDAILRPRMLAAECDTREMDDCCQAGYHLLHFEGTNVLYVDGHVKWQKKSNVNGKVFGSITTANDGLADPNLIAY